MDENAFFIVRYGELGLKSGPVKRRFLNRLRSNMEKMFLDADIDCYLNFVRGRLYVYPGDLAKGAEILAKTFGVVSISPGISLDTSELAEIAAKGVEYSHWLLGKGDSFAVRARRVGNHTYTSQDVNVMVGAEIMKNNTEKALSVKLRSPDKTLYIEIRDNTSFFYHQKIQGPGGLPLGVSGSSVCAVGNEASLLAAYLMMKRGNRLHLFYVPQIYGKPLSKEEALTYLGRFILRPVMEELPEASLVRSLPDKLGESTAFRCIGNASPPSGASSLREPVGLRAEGAGVSPIRRSLRAPAGSPLPDDIFGILDSECYRKRARAIVLGFDLEDFAEILEGYGAKPTEHPVFYPVIGFSKGVIHEMFEDTISEEEP